MKVEKLNVDGNKLAFIVLDTSMCIDDCEKDMSFRNMLCTTYRQSLDSVVLLQKISNGYRYEVFDPNNGEYGNFSNMCGNGVKGVCALLGEKHVQVHTRAGIFHGMRSDGIYTINAGKYICCRDAIDAYTARYDSAYIKKSILRILSKELQSWLPVVCFGYNAQNANFVGEPHVVIFFLKQIDTQALISIAATYTPRIENLDLFKTSVNITYASLVSFCNNTCELNACTFERNMGDGDPTLAITGSCGTGSMAAANTFSKKILKKKMDQLHVRINFPASQLHVSLKRGSTILYGDTYYEKF